MRSPPATGSGHRPDSVSGSSRPLPARALAARAVHQVLQEGRALDDALAGVFAAARAADRGFIQEMAYGALRWAHQLQAIAGWYVPRPLKAGDQDVAALLLVGLYQLRFMRLPAHAAVMETVNAAAALGKPWAKGLVNAVLRSVQRDAAQLAARIAADPAIEFSHPPWLLARIQQAWPAHWRAILAANNERPPMTLRVNLSKLSRAAYLEKLAAAGARAAPLAGIDSGLTLAAPCAVTELPGFADGLVSVQDGGAQLAAIWLDARPGERVLDACAAPGGKACHVLERAAVELVAVDRDGARLERLRENLRRLQLAAEVIAADAAEPAGWWDGRPFQRILLDAPCSASGVIRRHPDIKLHRRPSDLERLARGQARLLAGLWPLLAPGGKLLYVTCSILPEENADQITRFLAEHADAAPTPLATDLGQACAVGVQLLPGEHELDGFYYACLQKRP